MTEIPIDLGHGKDPTVSMRTDFNASDQLAGEEALASVYQQCIKYGDYSLFETCGQLRRADLQSCGAFTICPEDLVNINPELADEGWKGYWFVQIPGNPMSFRDLITLKGMGFRIANTNDGFRTMTFEVREDGVIHWDVLTLMVQPATQYKRRLDERNIPAKHLVQASREAFHGAVDEVRLRGIGSFEAETDGEEISYEDARSVVRPG